MSNGYLSLHNNNLPSTKGMLMFVLCLLCAAIHGATGLVAKCNNDTEINGITAEGGALNCTCMGSASAGSRFYWPGHSSGPNLLVSSVTRDQNGTVYTCKKETPGQDDETATHVLLVAYGPLEGETVIKERSSSTGTGEKKLTLECVARNVYPSPLYAWPRNPQCGNKPKCTFSPQASNKVKKVYCTATNLALARSGTGVYTINVTATSSASIPKPLGGHLLLTILLRTIFCLTRSWNFRLA